MSQVGIFLDIFSLYNFPHSFYLSLRLNHNADCMCYFELPHDKKNYHSVYYNSMMLAATNLRQCKLDFLENYCTHFDTVSLKYRKL